jgi:hypothetical protein
MGVLQDFERRLEGAVEGFFARAFRSGIQPIELAKALQRYAEQNQHVTADGVVVPNVYRLTVGPKDHERLAGFGRSLPRELAEVVVRTAVERGWSLRGPVKVRIDVDGDVRYGRFTTRGRVETVDEAPPDADQPSRLRGGSRRRDPGGDAAHDARGASPSRPPAPNGDASRDGHRPDARRSLHGTQVVPPVAAAAHELVVRSGPDIGARVPVAGSRITAGRLSSCTLTLTDSTVSREHAAVVRRGDRWWVVDLGSTNGTRVNGVQAAEQPIAPGDRIELGDVELEFVGG